MKSKEKQFDEHEQANEFCNDPMGHSLMYYNMETGDTICCICQKKIKVMPPSACSSTIEITSKRLQLTNGKKINLED